MNNIKIIGGHEEDKFESKVNGWFERNPKLDIKSVQYSVIHTPDPYGSSSIYYSVMIQYRGPVMD